MSLRAAMIAAHRHGMILRPNPTSPGLCAIICPHCGYGEGIFDQLIDSYPRAPYGCDCQTSKEENDA